MVVLDTHAWIWYVTESPKLSPNALKAIQSADICGISAISCWEVAMLIEKKRIEFRLPLELWMNLALEYDKIQLIPLSPDISIKAATFGKNFHGDPADRIIVASSLQTHSPLITKDDKIRESGFLTTIW